MTEREIRETVERLRATEAERAKILRLALAGHAGTLFVLRSKGRV